ANFLPDQYRASDAPRLYRPGQDATGARVGVDPVTGQMVAATYIGRIVPNTGKLTNGVFQAGKGIEQGLYRNRGVHFAPRFGFAYDVFGGHRLVVRGGAGGFFVRPRGKTGVALVRKPPPTHPHTRSF